MPTHVIERNVPALGRNYIEGTISVHRPCQLPGRGPGPASSSPSPGGGATGPGGDPERRLTPRHPGALCM
jgi:hypothetical protein